MPSLCFVHMQYTFDTFFEHIPQGYAHSCTFVNKFPWINMTKNVDFIYTLMF